MQQAAAPKVSFVSLGCPKALVDSERIITRLRAEGYELARKHDGADLVIVNTCGFLDSAKQESLGAIGEAMAENGRVIVTGCMGAEPEQIEAASLWSTNIAIGRRTARLTWNICSRTSRLGFSRSIRMTSGSSA